jgi:hypothetical protein
LIYLVSEKKEILAKVPEKNANFTLKTGQPLPDIPGFQDFVIKRLFVHPLNRKDLYVMVGRPGDQEETHTQNN